MEVTCTFPLEKVLESSHGHIEGVNNFEAMCFCILNKTSIVY